MVTDDPFAVLGVSIDASPAEIAAARRRLARSQHPDHGGDLSAMQALNAAHDEALRQRVSVVPDEADPQPQPEPKRSSQRVQRDSPAFVVDVAPSAAHEALLVVGAWIGEVIVSNPPHMIECLLDEPLRCWCRLDLAPEGEATSISLIVERYDAEPAPDIDAVRDEWVANLNQL
ncbi:MAG: hypothetical protein K8R99_06945 [Actinomycetia bacterium]|nr:hypothetical protein [Actinomycetes bacterium]